MMYDMILKDTLLNLNKADNINDLNYNRKEMLKIIKCRTLDKLYLLKYLYSTNCIDLQKYLEYIQIAKDDYRRAILYIIGRVSLTDIE